MGMKPNDKKKEWQKACIEGQTNIRSYMIKTENGGSYRSNRAHFRRTNENFSTRSRLGSPIQFLNMKVRTTARKTKNHKSCPLLQIHVLIRIWVEQRIPFGTIFNQICIKDHQGQPLHQFGSGILILCMTKPLVVHVLMF